ncbi:uncharacterized protein LOC133737517 [Rosa rugosa]|uniref:uncharacterized protein LOC133737517 n=1 Tax=Rosa rugosa TaxID=74645 RepID=UPI002B411258|nr:uncharacterized protein LOC133737517 [Rosa rugosa]
MVNAHKDRIPEKTKEILKGTDFGEMMEPFWQDKITEIQLHKHEADLEILMRHFDRTDNKWKFGDVVMEITEEDITTLFHLPAEGEVFNVNRRVVREEMEDSPIFGSPLKTHAVLRTKVESNLVTELTKLAKEKDARKIAVLMITYLFSTFFFTRTGAQITWDMVAVCERIENINMYNWPRLILNFLMEGLQKYRRNSPSVLNGCLLLIYYWFLEKTRAKTWILGKQNETPRFIRWSIKEIFSLEQLYRNENLAVDLIKAGPWQGKIGLEDLKMGDEVQDTPSFDNWVPQASQTEEEQNERLTGNIKELIREMEAAIGETKPTKEMEAKLGRLAKANEELNAQNKDLWVKLKVADERIKELEIEKRAKNNLIRALYIRLEKEKGEVPPPQKQLEIVPFMPKVVPQDEVEDENPNFGQSVGEETHYAASVGKSTDTVTSTFPIAEEIPGQQDESRLQPGQQVHGNEEEDEQLDNIIRIIAEKEVMGVMGKEKQREGTPAKQEPQKKTPEIHSIVKNVKTYRRAAKKAREEEWEYDTPEEAKITKRAAPKKAGIMLQAQRKMLNNIKIKGVKCDKPTWRTLDPAVARHYRDFFNVAVKDTTEYWTSIDLLRRITKHDLRVIIQEGDIETDVISVYMDLLKSDAEKLNAQVGFLTVDAGYYAIKYEQTKEQDEDTRPFECGVETMIYEPLWSVFRFKKVLVPIHHTTSMHYTLLVIDNETRMFSHMNSLRPPINEFTNEEKYQLNAARVVCSKAHTEIHTCCELD